MTETELHAPGIFGTFPSALIPGMEVVEAGQISTGSIIKWFTANFLNSELKGEAKSRAIHIYQLWMKKPLNCPRKRGTSRLRALAGK